jgi:hypothetical protein
VLVGDGVRDVVPHIGRGHLDRPGRIVRVNGRVVLPEIRLAVLAEEEPVALREVASDELPHLGQLAGAVGRCDEDRRDARELGESAREVGDVVEHEVRDGDVELVVRERQRLDVRGARVDAARPRQLDHVLGLVDGDHLERVCREPFRELAAAASDLEHPRRRQRDDSVEGDVERLPPAAPRPDRLPSREPGVVGVLPPDDVRVVLLAHDVTKP